MTTSTDMTVAVTKVPEGVSGTSKRAGRAPCTERVAIINARFGSEAKFLAWEKTATHADKLVARDEINKEVAKAKALAKNGGVPGLVGRQPSASRVEAVSRLHKLTYLEFRGWAEALSDEERAREMAKISALTTLIEAGVTLTADEADVFTNPE